MPLSNPLTSVRDLLSRQRSRLPWPDDLDDLVTGVGEDSRGVKVISVSISSDRFDEICRSSRALELGDLLASHRPHVGVSATPTNASALASLLERAQPRTWDLTVAEACSEEDMAPLVRVMKKYRLPWRSSHLAAVTLPASHAGALPSKTCRGVRVLNVTGVKDTDPWESLMRLTGQCRRLTHLSLSGDCTATGSAASVAELQHGPWINIVFGADDEEHSERAPEVSLPMRALRCPCDATAAPHDGSDVTHTARVLS